MECLAYNQLPSIGRIHHLLPVSTFTKTYWFACTSIWVHDRYVAIFISVIFQTIIMFFTLPMRAKALLYKAFAAMLLTLACTIANAQLPDTFRLTIPAAEKIFLQKNLQLLAAKYNIDANQALIDQAKLWDNPVLSTDQNIYDAAGGFFSHNKTNGQFYIQISQLIRTAGKRNKEAQLAADNTTLSKAQFNELLRTLRSILINDLLQTRFLQETQQVYDLQIMELKNW